MSTPLPPVIVVSASSAPLPLPRVPVVVRVATLADLPFMDELQKKHAKMVGWMPLKQLEEKVRAGSVLVAEDPALPSPAVPQRLGYVIGQDQYFKRDDVGIVYQLNVAPGRQRSLIGATLLKALFERAAYGCRLFCCWCAQDIEANYFWESMGFVPLAFRSGSAKKARVHIFWQRRIRAGDCETPYWFPSRTTGGSIREDRLVLPIPPGTHWRDAKPILLPTAGVPGMTRDEPTGPRALPDRRKRQAKAKDARTPTPTLIASGGLRLVAPKPAAPDPKPAAEPKRKVKNDPRLVAAARELRDRWLERVNADGLALEPRGKYDVARRLTEHAPEARPQLLLPAA